MEKWLRMTISIELTKSQMKSQMRRKLRRERKMYKVYSKRTVRNKIIAMEVFIMKMDISILDKLAEMICGDSPYDNFPYRSSSYLTRFFRGVDLDYVHDGSTRRLWVSNVLEELNKEDNSDPDLPSPKLIKVIEYLLNPVHFKNSTGDYESAIKEVNEILQIKNLIIVKVGLTNNVKLQKIVSGYVSTSISSDEAKNVITFTPSVFDVPNKSVEANLVSVMIPFDISFDNVLEAIKAACSSLDLNCKRVDDIWINSIIIQDIFELIYCSSIVIVPAFRINPPIRSIFHNPALIVE